MGPLWGLHIEVLSGPSLMMRVPRLDSILMHEKVQLHVIKTKATIYVPTSDSVLTPLLTIW